jgi:hypothetical protein
VRNRHIHSSGGASRLNLAEAIKLNKEGPQIELTVADDGVGMRDRGLGEDS